MGGRRLILGGRNYEEGAFCYEAEAIAKKRRQSRLFGLHIETFASYGLPFRPAEFPRRSTFTLSSCARVRIQPIG